MRYVEVKTTKGRSIIKRSAICHIKEVDGGTAVELYNGSTVITEEEFDNVVETLVGEQPCDNWVDEFCPLCGEHEKMCCCDKDMDEAINDEYLESVFPKGGKAQ